ncbi:MAG TPA: DUF202 domain-containing protein [Amnibacterium sp.]|uniref:DUF202 domain-containing protein n=1 Tax=Amnibacterium sp. TaxID=1872496 RepID=UPI002F93FE6E
MTTEKGPWDPGLQPERTALAWRRSVLSLLIGSAAAIRILPPVVGLWSLSIGITGVLVSSALWVASAERVRREDHALRAGTSLPGGLLLALLAATVMAAAAAGIAISVLFPR